MARNIEIKAKLADRVLVEARTKQIASGGPWQIPQDDTFFTCAAGRMKLRELAVDHGQLVFYNRPDQEGPKLSDYHISDTAEPAKLRDLLTRAYGATGRVIKQRTLYMAGRTRIHLDEVRGLGDYLELEVVLRDDETAETGIAEARALLEALGVPRQALEARAYVDLLRDQCKA